MFRLEPRETGDRGSAWAILNVDGFTTANLRRSRVRSAIITADRPVPHRCPSPTRFAWFLQQASDVQEADNRRSLRRAVAIDVGRLVLALAHPLNGRPTRILLYAQVFPPVHPTTVSAENFFSRKQLAFYVERKSRPRRLNNAARIALVVFAPSINWRQLLVVVRSETLVQCTGRDPTCSGWRSRRRGRPRIPLYLLCQWVELGNALKLGGSAAS